MLLQRHVLPGQDRPALQAKVMQGMLTGFMDLVLQHEGRFWVLDYKSNLLANYQTQHLCDAVLAKRYEVQYVLYTLALHRLLQSRLPGYNYEQHMGGAIYLFLRGIDSPQAGVHALRPAWALIDQLDSLFAKTAP
jgi:exodeoxyribonuclease V beta subunit